MGTVRATFEITWRTMSEPRIHVAPFALPAFLDSVRTAGGVISEPDDADAIVWTNHLDPPGLAALLRTSPARWVQLPFAGIESFFAAGLIDDSRVWTCAKGAYGHATAELALTLMLVAARRIHVAARPNTWVHDKSPHQRLAGTTALIVGAGAIGQHLIAMLSPMRVRVLAVNRSGKPVDGVEQTVPTARLAELLPEADWVVIACAHTAETHHLIDADALSSIRPDAWLVNVARGGIVDQDALVDALRAGTIAGAMLDVTDPEPLPDEHPLWTMENVLITSHTGNTPTMAIPELASLIERNVRAFASGAPLEGIVDVALGY